MIKPFHSKGLNHDKKTTAFTAMQLTSKSMVEPQKTNSGFHVMLAAKLLFIKELISNIFVKNDGLNFGYKKAILFEGFQNFLVTALRKSNRAKITGFQKHRHPTLIFQRSNAPFMMALILAKATASSFL